MDALEQHSKVRLPFLIHPVHELQATSNGRFMFTGSVADGIYRLTD